MRAFVGFAAIFGPVLVAVGLAYMTGPDSAPVIVLAGFTLTVAAGIGAWGRTRERAAALERLALIRTAGVELRNEGLARVTSDAESKSWIARYDTWREGARVAVEKVAKHEALGFVTIGHYEDEDWRAVINGHPQYADMEHLRKLAFLTSDCRRLDEIRRRNS